jgi:hypothetical protein
MKKSIKIHLEVVDPQVEHDLMLTPPLLTPLQHPPLRLHGCQQVLLQNTVVALEHLPYKVVDGAASLKLVVPALLLNEQVNQLPLHVLYPITDLLLLIVEVFLLASESG